MMSFKKVLIGLVLLQVILSSALADQEFPEIACGECAVYFGDYAYCNSADICTVSEEPINTPATTTNTAVTANAMTTASEQSASTESAIIDEQFEQSISELSVITHNLQGRVTALESDYILIQNQLGQLTVAQNSIPVDQINNLRTQLTSISTGLAGLQESTSKTLVQLATVEDSIQEKTTVNSILTISLLTLIAITAALSILYYITTRKNTLSSEVRAYITQQVKMGRKYAQIRENLLRAGWADEDIKQAYTKTIKHNYQKYKTSSASKSRNSPTNKMALAIVLSILVLLGGILILRGVTGKAIQFGTMAELNTAVYEKLQETAMTNPFYASLPNVDLCIEVKDGEKVVSYTVSKSGVDAAIMFTSQLCSQNPAHDASLRFNSWQSFENIADDPSCENIRQTHNTAGGLVVLPSRYVLPGFHKNPTLDYTPYCTTLALCLSPAELAVVGC